MLPLGLQLCWYQLYWSVVQTVLLSVSEVVVVMLVMSVKGLFLELWGWWC